MACWLQAETPPRRGRRHREPPERPYTKGDRSNMYFKSKRECENYGYRFSPNWPSIHITGSVRGMKNLGYWPANADVVRVGSWIYLCST